MVGEVRRPAHAGADPLDPLLWASTVIGPEERNPNDPLAVPHYTPVLRTGLGFVQGTRTLHTELTPWNPGCSQRW
eukprot:7201773-Pyramimonas_sp.AAC.1